MIHVFAKRMESARASCVPARQSELKTSSLSRSNQWWRDIHYRSTRSRQPIVETTLWHRDASESLSFGPFVRYEHFLHECSRRAMLRRETVRFGENIRRPMMLSP